METELSSKLHLDSLVMASQLVPGEMTKNSRMPYLPEQTREIKLNAPEHSFVISPNSILSILISVFFFLLWDG